MHSVERGDIVEQDVETESYTEDLFEFQREENLVLVQRTVALGIVILLISAIVYIGFLVIGENGLVSYRPGDQALESQEIYSDLIEFNGIQSDGDGIRVCIVDSGIMMEHDDLDSVNLVEWKDFVNNQASPYDDHGHGTSMAGILVADGWMKGLSLIHI